MSLYLEYLVEIEICKMELGFNFKLIDSVDLLFEIIV